MAFLLLYILERSTLAMMYNGEEYITAEEAHNRYGVGTSTPHIWFARGLLTGYRQRGKSIPIEEELAKFPKNSGRLYHRLFKASELEKLLLQKGRNIPMRVYKCDRCGKVRENTNGMEMYVGNKRISSVRMLTFSCSTGYHYNVDLCDDCLKELASWMDKKEEN